MFRYQGDWNDPAAMAHDLAYLRQRLSEQYGFLDEHLLDECAEDAMLRHLAFPERFDATRGVPLSFYLELWARSFLDRRLRKENNHRRHEKTVGVSDKIFEAFGSEKCAERSIYLGRERKEQEVEKWREALDGIVGQLKPSDRAKVDLLRDGATFHEWVWCLGIPHVSLEEQRHKVYVEKDRLKKTLRRRAIKMQGVE